MPAKKSRFSSLINKLRYSADTRMVLYRGVKRFAIILAVGLVFKFFVCDSVRVEGSQMEPGVKAGDRVLLMKAPYATPQLNKFFAIRNKLTVASLPGKGAGMTILRIAAVSGDTASVDAGRFYFNGYAVRGLEKDTARYGVLPAEYSPADFMALYRVPAPGDTITFDGLTLRDLVFAYTVLRQEKSGVRLRAFAMAGDSIIGGYRIKDFSLYSGSIDSIPEELSADWFFWDRLREYMRMQGEETDVKPQLAFSLFRGAKELTGFRVNERYLFLMGDNWSGAKDSRYFGAVRLDRVVGRPVITLWGNGKFLGGLR
ncbi:MAG: S26 family signal peptidase [Chitinispirillales bacterium]|jgi:signal peptidase I|nr:S26 family signal peptidase [Chitinispirillales bacterium]